MTQEHTGGPTEFALRLSPLQPTWSLSFPLLLSNITTGLCFLFVRPSPFEVAHYASPRACCKQDLEGT
jgi:hypothetical protein